MESAIMIICSLDDLKKIIRGVVMECHQNSAPPPDNRRLISQEFCEFIHIVMTTLSNCSTEGVIHGRRIGKRILALESDVRAVLIEVPNRHKRKSKLTTLADETDSVKILYEMGKVSI